MSYSAGLVKTFSCPNCGGSVNIHAVGISITAVCKHCGATIDVANENLKVIQTASERTRLPFLEIGSRGLLFDVEWEVIGYMERQIQNAYGVFNWEEYLLFNPWQGFRFLVCSDRHWNFVKMLRLDIRYVAKTTTEYDKQTYHLFAKDKAKVTYVLGEFYWRVKVGEETRVADYVAPPYLLSKEENVNEVIWSQGIYVEPKQIKEAFKLSFLPEPEGIAPNQPSPVAQHLPAIKRLTLIFSAVLLLSQCVMSGLNENKTVFSRTVSTTPQQKEQVILTEPLVLIGKRSNLEISISAPVDNNWAMLAATLVNDQTQEMFDSSQVIEYYHGVDSEGAWSEGSQNSATVFPAVPPGNYHLLLVPDSGVYEQGAGLDFQVTVKHGVSTVSNFFIALLALLAPFFIVLYRHSAFERKRWADSDYAPMAYRLTEISAEDNISWRNDE